ncbi:transcriptional regulator ATRX homolog, partial [Galendromus occidentalis]|uniref:Transcriptional regulator ATRX homolog n=1 Tax=Galendromus occidentalis TaxID=34638 RepID=A0AAJ7SF68_9ACAR
MSLVRTRSKRLETKNDQLQSTGARKSRRPTRKKEVDSTDFVDEDSRENALVPPGRRRTAKRKQAEQDEEPEPQQDTKKRRVTRRSNVVEIEKAEESPKIRSTRGKRSKVEEACPESPEMEAEKPKPMGLKRVGLKPMGLKRPLKEDNKSTVVEQEPSVDQENAPSSRGRRNARKVVAEMVEFDPDEESETDFSDNDDDDFVLPESDKSDGEEFAPDVEPEPKIIATRRRTKPKELTRSDKIRQFLLDVDMSAPPGVSPVKKPDAQPEKPEGASSGTGLTSKPKTATLPSSSEESASESEDDEESPARRSRNRKQSRAVKGTPSS